MASAASDRPNIILLMADEHRYDALNCLGNPTVHSPNLDRMASQGVRFTHTYCQGPLCQPSRASIMTGRYPHQHGQTWNQFNMNPQWPTMMKQLQKAGYFTAKLGKAHFAGGGSGSKTNDLRDATPWGRSFGFDYLLEEYDKAIHTRPGIITPFTEYLRERKLLETYLAETTPVTDRAWPLYRPITTKLPQEHMECSFVADRSIDWLRGYKQDKPFFLWVSFIEPHPPIIDSARWAAHYKSSKISVGPVVMPDLPDNAWGRYLRTWIQTTRTAHLTPEIVAEVARHYYGEVSLVDQKVGDIFRAVDELGLGKNTWFFYTADHGEMLGDHKMMYKNVFYRGSVRVPNIVRPPGGMPAKTVDGLVESIDLTATFLDLAGTQMPECRGRSLLPLIKGEGKAREVVHSELAGHQNKGNFFVMGANQRYRYTYDKENKLACELYDLEKDHDEMHNLVDDSAYAGIRKDMHKDYVEEFMNS
jgi:arylsulfatase A-like enzyme